MTLSLCQRFGALRVIYDGSLSGETMSCKPSCVSVDMTAPQRQFLNSVGVSREAVSAL